MPQTHILVALVTILAVLLYLVMSMRVGLARAKYGVPAPAIAGNPDFERLFRVQANTLEWLPIFLPSLWLFAIYWNDRAAALIGLVWIIGRILYMIGYARAAGARAPGFAIQGLATLVLLLGALGKVAWAAVVVGV